MYQKNYYDILQLHPSCTTEEIKKAYRKLALQFHPDINDDDKNIFNNIKEAYEILIDTKTRTRYNRSFLGADVEEKKIDIETILNQSQQLLQYIQYNDTFTLNYELIGQYTAQLLQPYYTTIIHYNKNTRATIDIEKNILTCIELLPYEQIQSLTEKFLTAFPNHQQWLEKLLTEKKKIMLWEKYSVVFAILVAIGLCVFIAFISK